jgi:hypothetical protein
LDVRKCDDDGDDAEKKSKRQKQKKKNFKSGAMKIDDLVRAEPRSRLISVRSFRSAFAAL